MATSGDALTDADVSQIQQAIGAVVIGAMASEPGGPLTIVKEVVGGMRGLVDSLKASQSDVLGHILERTQSAETPEPDTHQLETEAGRGAAMTKGVDSAVAAVNLLKAKADPADADALAKALIAAADHAVSASRKGGFLGFGGEKVTPSEDAYVRRLTEALS